MLWDVTSNLRLCFFLVFPRRSSRRSTWPPTLTLGVWWTCRSTKVAPEWSGKMLEDAGELESFAHAICNLPQWACTKTPVLFSQWHWAWLCIYNIACTQRNQGCNVIMPWGNKQKKDVLPYFNLDGKFVWQNACYTTRCFNQTVWSALWHWTLVVIPALVRS